MNTEIIGIVFMYLSVVALAIPLGHYIGKVFNYESTGLDKVFNPLDNLFFKLSGLDPTQEMSWKQHLTALLMINAIWLAIAFGVLTNMSWLPLNPDNNPSMGWDLAFNTAISFVTNTNLQHYGGETGLSYLGQLVLMLWQFLSAGTGIAISRVVFISMKEKTTTSFGNFYSLLVRSCTRILLPLSVLVALLLVFNGTPMTFEGKDTIITLEGVKQNVSRGPVATFVAIKQLGTNGGGFYGCNSAHPFRKPKLFDQFYRNGFDFFNSYRLNFCNGLCFKSKKISHNNIWRNDFWLFALSDSVNIF